MRFVTAAGMVSMAILADNVLANPVCGGESIVFVTVSAPAVTKTVTISSERAIGPANVETTLASTDITATLTSYVTLTDFVSVVPVTPTTPGSDQTLPVEPPALNRIKDDTNEGPYYFYEQDGTLEWLDGKTPPATRSFLTSTAVITVEPVPTGVTLSDEESAVSTAPGSVISTTYSTISLYRVSTIYQTRVVTSTIPAPTASAKAFVALGSSGWNTSVPTLTSFPSLLRASEENVAASSAASILGQTNATEKGNPTAQISNLATPSSATNVTKQLEARQLGATVVATIDGALVTWINTFDGPVPSPEPLISWINIFTGPFAAEPTPSPSIIAAEEPIEENDLKSAGEPVHLPPFAWGLTPPVTRDPLSGPPHDTFLSPENVALYPWQLISPEAQTEHATSDRITSSVSLKDEIIQPVNEPENVALYAWDLSLPSSSTSSSATRRIVTSVAQVEKVVPTSEPENLAIYPWDLTPPQPQTTTPNSGNISSFAWSSKSPDRASSQDKLKSTFSTVTRKFVTSVLSFTSVRPTASFTSVRPTTSFTSVRPTASNGASGVQSLDSPSGSNTPSTCNGEISSPAEFVLSFDDLPSFSTGPNSTDVPPLFNPYRKLYFEEHFGYVPPPSVPFLPHSPPQLAVYRAESGLNVNGSPGAGLELIGEFGSGPRALYSAFWIDAYSLWIGCQNEGPSDCEVNINGYELASSTRTAFQDVTIPPCPGLKNCELTYVELGDDFRNLTGLQILASVDRQLAVYYLDDVSLAWSNNTCAAQRQRTTVR